MLREAKSKLNFAYVDLILEHAVHKEDSLLLLTRVFALGDERVLSLSRLWSSVLYTNPSHFFSPSLQGMSAALQ